MLWIWFAKKTWLNTVAQKTKYFFLSSKKAQSKENNIVTFTALPGQALCMQISPSYRAPEDSMPESRELPNQWKSWQICWWRQWFPKGPGTVVPAEGACEQRTARSALFSWRRSRAYIPPADLKTRQGFIIKLIIPFRKKRILIRYLSIIQLSTSSILWRF